MTKKTWISIIFLLMSLFYLFKDIDIQKFYESLKYFPIQSFALLITGTLLSYVFLALRWKVLGGKSVNFRGSLESSIISIGINNIAPARIGDLSRIFYLKKIYQIPLYKLIPISILERVLDLSGLMMIGAVFAFSYNQLRPIIYSMLVLLVVIILIMGILIRRPLVFIFYLRKLKFKKVPIFNKVKIIVIRSIIAFSRIHPKQLILSFFMTLFLWFFYVVILYGFLHHSKLQEVELTYIQAIMVFVVVGLGVSLPSTPGSLGVYEAAFVLSMGWFNIQKEYALSFAIVYHVMQIILSVALTFLILSANKIKSINSIK